MHGYINSFLIKSLIMIMKKPNLFFSTFLALFIFGVSACSQGGEGAKLFKGFNKDKNDYLSDLEFYNAIAEMNYFERWNPDNDEALSEDEWSAGVNEYLGSYKVSTVEKFGEWDLSGDSQISVEEFREGLLEVVDKDGNNQISESEFTNWYKEGGEQGSRSGS
jgi:Ca2+-binding EF-hand superfamily protein